MNKKWFHTEMDSFGYLDQNQEMRVTKLQKQLNRLRAFLTLVIVGIVVYVLTGCGGGGMSEDEVEAFDKEYAAMKEDNKTIQTTSRPQICITNPIACE